MNIDSNSQLFFDQLETLILNLERPAFQLQLIAFLGVLFLAYVLSRLVGYQVAQKPASIWGMRRVNKRRRWLWWLGLLALRYLTYPVAGLILLRLIIILFWSLNWFTALLVYIQGIFWLVLYYRLGITLLYFFFGRRYVRHYHQRVLAPLMTLIIAWQVFEVSIGLQVIMQIRLGTPFSDKSILLGQVIWALIAVYFLTALAWTTQHSLETFIFPRTTLEPGAIEAALTLGRYVFILIGGLIVLIGLGFDITSLAVIGGGLSVGIGFGLQKVVSNFISGVILLFEQPLRPGDSVEVAGVAGTVEKLDVRTTVLRRSSDNMIIIIPNETLFTSSIVNTTRNIQATKLLIEVGASYTSDPDEVMRLLRNVCAEYELVAKSPAPGITFKGYGESSLDFEVAVWVEKKEHRSQVPTELRVRILREFQKCGIEMPYLQQDIHIHGSLPGPALNQGSESVAGLSGG